MAVRLPDAPVVVRWAFWGGVALVLATSALGRAWGALLFALWALVPWLVLRALPLRIRDPWPTSTAATALLLGETWVRAQVFLFPKGSTAALLLIFSPAYLLVGVLPVGLAVGFVLGWIWRRTGAPGRASVVATGLLLVGFLVTARFAPGLLPSRLARFVSAKERIGPPRVITGDGWLRRTPLSDRSAWYLAGDFDAEPGDEIAEIAEGAVILRDPVGFAEKSRWAMSTEARRRWNWPSTLFRDGGELLVVDQGGGFQDVGVWDLEGRTRWRFRPEATLPPVALLPADLDEDGRTEFYAASGQALYRLDGAGRVVWTSRGPKRLDALDVHTSPEGGRVVGLTAGQSALLRDAAGRALGTVELPRDEYRYRFVDWPEPRCLVGGSSALKVLDPVGRLRLQFDLGEFVFSEAAAARWDAGAFLAVLAAGPRDARVWRLVVLDPRGAVAYDEVLSRGGRLLVARAADGKGSRLFLVSEGLVAYDRPLAP
jgi:hypothetical protein